MTNQDLKKGEIIIYKTSENEVELRVKLEDETIWLTQKMMAELFGVEIPTINYHLAEVYKSAELKEERTIRKFRIVQDEGGRSVEREVAFYNLDAIISVGYRVNSQKATQFRIWATKILKQYLVKGFVINEKRLLEAKNKFHELQEAVLFLQKQSKSELLKGQETEILSLLADYSKTLSLLEKYDKGKVDEQKGIKTNFVLEYEDCAKIISKVKTELIAKKEASDLFGQERGGSFEGIIKGLYQTFASEELYSTIEDKASHLLYLIIKDHPFNDGNKRSAAFLFVYFLDKTNYLFKKSGERKINDNALTALALLIAESDPKDKEIMIKIVKNLLSSC